MRHTISHNVTDIEAFKTSMLVWAQQFDEAVLLDSNQHASRYHSYEAILAVEGLTGISTDSYGAFDDLKEYQQQTNDWIFGYLSYDLKNDTEKLVSGNYDGLEFPELYFFQPKKIIKVKGDKVEFCYLNMVSDEIDSDLKEILDINTLPKEERKEKEGIKIKMRIFKDEYFKRLKEILSSIHKGDIYEANFCQEFYAENVSMDPLGTFTKLNTISKAPFAAYLKIFDKFLLCASPERYLKRSGNKIISQPIKGTAARSSSLKKDRELKENLASDTKERSENIMIVDLVRNDLSKNALKGSVVVEELCKVYSFEQVHQMISTIACEVESTENPVDIIENTFPMGSMTGAPKISAMEIIEKMESFKRGLYSGAVGYFAPNGDFDFNVVIRSILYNETKKYLSYAVGSAITAKSVPEKEYEECLLKAKAMRQVLE
ncbi:anthranilate synthase component I family protein [Maribacter thermophilus]|uniref:anthranilate synthase component I family protein n=1 Tax=Maribacter thermophilus TaxID=1197874 RepID=UPI000640D057|nr:anthranilate synthase component I family protein [Maribacter thermophilus]